MVSHVSRDVNGTLFENGTVRPGDSKYTLHIQNGRWSVGGIVLAGNGSHGRDGQGCSTDIDQVESFIG